MKLTKPRRELLEKLERCGGKATATMLPIPSRRLATQMQADGLVQWRVDGGIGSRHTCVGQTLYITAAGCRALAEASTQ